MNATIAYLNLSVSLPQCNQRHQLFHSFSNHQSLGKANSTNCDKTRFPNSLYCQNSDIYTPVSPSETEEDADEDNDTARTPSSPAGMIGNLPPVRLRRRRYRKEYPGEKNGITEEMRFVAMKLRNRSKPRKSKKGNVEDSGSKKELECERLDSGGDEHGGSVSMEGEEDSSTRNEEAWQPSIEGFLKYLVDSKLVFSTIELIVDESNDVSYAYFRKTGLERSECLSKDLLWFSEGGNMIPEPSSPGVAYAKYLEELAEKTPPLFFCHFYNIYFSHIAGGQVIAKKVSEKLLEGRKLEFCTWEGEGEEEEEELLRKVRENLNMLGEHWSRDEKNRCLAEARKAFRFLGQIVRLIIL